MFGAKRRQLRRLEEQLAEAEAALEESGALSLVEIKQRAAQDLEAFEAERKRREAELAALDREKERARQQLGGLETKISQARNELVEVRFEAELQGMALFDFQHPAESSAILKDRLDQVRREYKQMVRDKTAAQGSEGFTFNNSAAKGRKFVKDMSATLLAAYNAEAENAVKSVRSGNSAPARNRLERSLARIERNGRMIDLKINRRYHRLRLEEIDLAAKHLEALKMEKELERERRAELREQNRAEKELRAEQARLAKEKEHYINALAKVQERGDEEEAARIEALLVDVDRAIADVDYRAANIRAGYVYVISNIGAMGEGIVKIGMTRRLEPYDRIKELSSASVPFPFDVHALFFAKDAVSVEAQLHHKFASERVNKVNMRRELFYASPQDVLDALKEQGVSLVEYVVEPEAEQFRISRASIPS